jgi:hypothetical protein
MQEYGGWVDPDTVDLRHLIYVSDKIAQDRQAKQQKEALRQGGGVQLPTRKRK